MYARNDVIRQFETTIAEYCGAPYGVAVESCTAALFLCCKYLKVKTVSIPNRTYFSVPRSIQEAGGKVCFTAEYWQGAYRLQPYPIIDSAMRLRPQMYQKGTYQCLSFHYAKHIPIGRGGMILTDDKKAVRWLRLMRNDGRQEIPKEKDRVFLKGYNLYMTPEQAARGLSLYYWRIHGRYLEDLEMTHGDISYIYR